MSESEEREEQKDWEDGGNHGEVLKGGVERRGRESTESNMSRLVRLLASRPPSQSQRSLVCVSGTSQRYCHIWVLGMT